MTKQFGLYVAAVAAVTTCFLTAWDKLGLHERYGWLGFAASVALISVPILVVVGTVTIPHWWERRRARWLVSLGVQRILASERFPLHALGEKDQARFERPDGAHEQVLRWIENARVPLLYLTGASGTGKSSIVCAWVMPRLAERQPPVRSVLVRSFGDPLKALIESLKRPGAIWERKPPETADARELLERAARQVAPMRLMIVLDQFEEFLIMHQPVSQSPLRELLISLSERPISDVTIVAVCRSDYLSELQGLGLSDLHGYENWMEIGPFNRAAAQRFVERAGLQLSSKLAVQALDEAAEVEIAPGLYRPITLNILGRALERYAGSSIPLAARGRLIRAWLVSVVQATPVRDVAPKLLECMITEGGSKRPMLAATLSQEISTDIAVVRGCLGHLALQGLVREIDRDRSVWEISHDFVARLLLPIVVRTRPRIWGRIQPSVVSSLLIVWLLTIAFMIYILPEWQYMVTRQNFTDLGFSIVGSRERGHEITAETVDNSSIQQFLKYNHRLIKIDSLYIKMCLCSSMNLSSGIPGIQSLRIDDGEYETIEGLESLSSLKSLEILRGWKLERITGYDSISALETLTLNTVKIQKIAFSKINSAIEKVDIRRADSLETLEGIRYLHNIKELVLNRSGQIYVTYVDTNLSNDNSDRAMTALETTEAKELKIDGLQDVKGLNSLSVDLDFARRNLESIARISSLEELSISSSGIMASDQPNSLGANKEFTVTKDLVSRIAALREQYKLPNIIVQNDEVPLVLEFQRLAIPGGKAVYATQPFKIIDGVISPI